MIEQLRKIFVGRRVSITHVGNSTKMKDVEGICTSIIETQPGFDIEIDGRVRYGFTPETLTETSSDGPLNAGWGGRRKIQVII